MLVAMGTEAGKGHLERGWKVDLGSAWQGCVCSEEKAPGTAGVAESLIWTEMQQLRNSRKAVRS